MDKLSYYDTLADLLPGIVFVWATPILGPLVGGKISLLLSGNQIVDAVLFVSLSFVIGHVIQFISKYTTEPFLKRVFWRNHLFSEIFLIKAFGVCVEPELSRYLSLAKSKLGFTKENVGLLLDADVIIDKTKTQKAVHLSQAIYRAVDAKTQDSTIALKAHIQNTFYSLFRNLSSLFFLLGLSDAIALTFSLVVPSTSFALMTVANIVLATIFLIRAKQRGELYVRGVFWSFSSGE